MTMDILVVDDEPAMRELFIDLLDGHGHRVVAGNDLPMEWPSGGFDRIILDLNLPSGPCWQWARTAKQRLGRADRIIITTASGDPAAAAIAREEGFVFLMKPFQLDDLDEALRVGGGP